MNEELRAKYEAWKAKTSAKDYKGRNISHAQVDRNTHFANLGTTLRAQAIAHEKKKRPAICPFGRFESRKKMKLYFIENDLLGCPIQKMGGMPHLYYYEDEGPGEPTYENVFYSPYGVTNNLMEIVRKAIAEGNEMFTKQKDSYHAFSKMCKIDPENYYKRKEIKREWLLEK